MTGAVSYDELLESIPGGIVALIDVDKYWILNYELGKPFVIGENGPKQGLVVGWG